MGFQELFNFFKKYLLYGEYVCPCTPASLSSILAASQTVPPLPSWHINMHDFMNLYNITYTILWIYIKSRTRREIKHICLSETTSYLTIIIFICLYFLTNGVALLFPMSDTIPLPATPQLLYPPLCCWMPRLVLYLKDCEEPCNQKCWVGILCHVDFESSVLNIQVCHFWVPWEVRVSLWRDSILNSILAGLVCSVQRNV